MVADVSASGVASTSAATSRSPISASFVDNSFNEEVHLSSSNNVENNDDLIEENNVGEDNSFVAPPTPLRSRRPGDDSLFVAPQPPPRSRLGVNSLFVALQPPPASRTRPADSDQAR
jgi:hypothetical protein